MINDTLRHSKHVPAVAAALPVLENRQAWYGHDMAKRTDWIYTLTQEDLKELDDATRIAAKRVGDPVHMRLEDFGLTAFADALRTLREELLHGRGFFLIRGFPVERYDIRECAIAFMGLGHHLGEPVSQNGKGHVLGHVKDLGLDIRDPETRYYQTDAQLDFHTDYSDVVGLLCLKTSRTGGQSTLVSSTTLYNEMVRQRPDLVMELLKPLCYTRWGEIPEGKQRYGEVPVFMPVNGRMVAFLNVRTTLMKAQRFPEVPRLTARQVEALDFLDALARDPSTYLSMEFRPGDMQFVCNHSVLHARTGYEDWPQPERRRHLLRLWLACEGGPRLPDCLTTNFQGRTDSGRPNGIQVPGVPFKAPLQAE
jgi:hypothetical protein